VGLKHSYLSEQQIAKLTSGAPVIVIPEWNNPVDPSAMAVLSPNGAKIGYLRKTLAQVMTARLTAQIAHVCSENFIPTVE